MINERNENPSLVALFPIATQLGIEAIQPVIKIFSEKRELR
jgi:hypothetical protein